MNKIIDTHNHLWVCQGESFDWIDKDSVIRRDFLIEDLEETLQACHVAGSILVQAEARLEETEALLDVAQQSRLVQGVIGWCEMSKGKAVCADLARLLAHSNQLKGIRYLSQGLPAEHLYQANFIEGVREVGRAGLVYELLITADQLPAAAKLIECCPEVSFVIEHIAKPAIRTHQIKQWQQDIGHIASHYPNVACKVSGLVIEADLQHWCFDDLSPYLDVVFERFGMERVLFGSDWPVCLLAASYQQWLDVLNQYFTQNNLTQTQGFYAGNAQRIYGLDQ